VGETPAPRTLRWYVTDDRRMYKPSEAFQLKGWLRLQIDYGGRRHRRPGRHVHQRGATRRDAQGNEFTQGQRAG
jgi:hypothetical protein